MTGTIILYDAETYDAIYDAWFEEGSDAEAEEAEEADDADANAESAESAEIVVDDGDEPDLSAAIIARYTVTLN